MRPTGQQILNLARDHLGEKYVFGTLVPKNDSLWRGPWDCAEFASWLVYQVARIKYGVYSANDDAETADAYTGYWIRDARIRGTTIPVMEAAQIPGAFIVRSPAENRGHIVVSDGLGKTVEAHSTAKGVIIGDLKGRLWTIGVLVPGIEFTPRGV